MGLQSVVEGEKCRGGWREKGCGLSMGVRAACRVVIGWRRKAGDCAKSNEQSWNMQGLWVGTALNKRMHINICKDQARRHLFESCKRASMYTFQISVACCACICSLMCQTNGRFQSSEGYPVALHLGQRPTVKLKQWTRRVLFLSNRVVHLSMKCNP